MDYRILKLPGIVALLLLPALSLKSQTVLEPLLRDPSRAEWISLSRFNETLTRGEFEQRLRGVFDPFHGLGPFLQITNSSVRVFAAENVTPIETTVAVRIAGRFQAVTGDPPVKYGNSANTRTVTGGNAFVIARNLAFNREHDGPVVVTEPYFMNEAVTLQRLLAGDYKGTRFVAGRQRISIFREYASNVTAGLADAYSANRKDR